VNSSKAFRCCLFVVLLASISWKIAVSSDSADNRADNLVDFFKRNHFDVAETDQTVNYLPALRARRASCSLLVVRLSPNGSDRDLLRRLVAGSDRVFVVFGGKVYTQQPVWWTVIDDIWSRHLRELGLSKRVATVIAVAADASCEAERLPWEQLQKAF
jgi:hypothetical protein